MDQSQQITTDETDDAPREPITAARVREFFDDAQYTPHAYSGRGMYGDHCLAVTTDSMSESVTVILDVIQACAENGGREDIIELVDLLRGSRSDSMGRGVVVYWPDIKWADCGGDRTDEDEDEDDYGSWRGDREDFHSDG